MKMSVDQLTPSTVNQMGCQSKWQRWVGCRSNWHQSIDTPL